MWENEGSAMEQSIDVAEENLTDYTGSSIYTTLKEISTMHRAH